MTASEHAVFLLPTQEDIAEMEAGRYPANVLLREFDTAQELVAYAEGVGAIEDENDELEEMERQGKAVLIGRNGSVERYDFGTEAQAEAFRRGVDDAEGFRSPLLIGRDDPRFVELFRFDSISLPSPR
jgi:hypothetical protein